MSHLHPPGRRNPSTAIFSPEGRARWLWLPAAFLAVAVLAIGLANEARAEPAVTRVELHIDEPHTGRTVPWPVTTGVPFPRGGLRDAAHCRLVDDRGTEQPLQTRVAATWDQDATSIRWLTVDFISQPGRRYFLEFGPGVRRTTKQASSVHVLQADPDEVPQVETGPLRVTFDVTKSAIKPSPATSIGTIAIALDLDADGRIAPAEQVATLPTAGQYYLDQDGTRYQAAATSITVESAGPVRAVVRIDGRYVGPDGKSIIDFRTRYHFFAGLPLIKVVDEFRPGGSTRGVRFRDIAFALQLTSPSSEPTVATDPRSLAVDVVPAMEGETPVTSSPSASPLTMQPLRVDWTPGTQSVSSYQALYRHFGNDAYDAAVVTNGSYGQRRISQSDRAAAWLQWADGRVAVTGSLRWFWQQFPKEWEASRDGLTLHTWSPRGGELDFSAQGIRDFLGPSGDRYLLNYVQRRGSPVTLNDFFYGACNQLIAEDRADGQGIRKSHEFYLHFAPAAQAADGVQTARLAEKPVVALASGRWNCGTNVFGPLAAREPRRNQADEKPAPPSKPHPAEPSTYQSAPSKISPEQAAAIAAKGEAVIDRLFQLARYGQDAFGDYGWWLFGAGPHYSYQWDAQARRHYADPRRFDFHTYQKETQLWWCYFRSGERKFLDWALPSENHWTDIAVSHVSLEYLCDWRGGEPAKSTRRLAFVPGDWAIDSPIHYLRHHNTAEAWLRGGTQFWASYHRTLETTTLAYYLTGDERFAEVVEYWRAYFAALAGVNSQSTDVPEHYRQQAWWDPGSTIVEDGHARPKTWAEMMRDYAPFPSGMRHQMTLWFNLSTLYEHTWDPQIGQALREYANAFLAPAGPSGVWHCQENRLPAHAPTPTMAHFWSPALWKYHRVTGDPRMKDVLRQYFDACYRADPFATSELVGVYSNLHAGYGYYFTGDARHLHRALSELEKLADQAAPLARPEDLNRRIYNPYVMIQSLAGIPRLLWAVQQAAQTGQPIPPLPPLRPQRTPILIYKETGQPLALRLWGFDEHVALLGPDGKPATPDVQTSTSPAIVQPFDRIMPDFTAYWHEVSLPANAPVGWYVLMPQLELGVLASSSPLPPLCHAARPIRLEPGETCWLGWTSQMALDSNLWRAGSAEVQGLQLTAADGTNIPLYSERARPGRLVTTRPGDKLPPLRRVDPISIRNTTERAAWFKVACDAHPDIANATAALFTSPEPLKKWAVHIKMPTQEVEAALQRIPLVISPDASAGPFIAGRHGKAALVVPGRKLILPDHVTAADGTKRKLFGLEQGTLEFFVKKLWDDRVMPARQGVLLNNGLIHGFSPWPLPVGEWAHVAVVWRPFRRDPSQTCVHIYVNGLDRANYRSTWWPGYGNRPYSLPRGKPWLEGFLAQTLDGGAFALDEVRLSSTARYADLEIEFGHRQTFNPVRFDPPEPPLAADEDTTLLYRLDGNLESEPLKDGKRLSGQWE